MKKLTIILCCILLAWFIGSWAEVAANNTTPNYQYSQINFFNIFD